jgi:hypothetical protein
MKTKLGLGLMVLALIISMVMMVGEAETADILKIGVVQPLGKCRCVGVPVDRGVRLAAEDINRAGGIRAVGKPTRWRLSARMTNLPQCRYGGV